MAYVARAHDENCHLEHVPHAHVTKIIVWGAFYTLTWVKSKIVCKLPAAPSYAASISSLCRLAMAASPAALFSSSITAGL